MVMVKLRMAQHVGDAVKFVEQGRILISHSHEIPNFKVIFRFT